MSKLRESEESYLRASNAILRAQIKLLQEHIDTLYWSVVPVAFVVGLIIGFIARGLVTRWL